MAMARKQKARGFNKFLDFIGLVDSERDNEFDPEYEGRSARSRGNTGRAVAMEDEFEEEPRMTRVSSRGADRTSKRSMPAANNSRFDDEDDWAAPSRPDYSAGRGNQRSSSSARTSAYGGKYGSESRYGSTRVSSASRYAESTGSNNSGHYSARDYSSAARPASSSYDSYSGASSRWSDAEEPAYGGVPSVPEMRSSAAGGYQRHQTVIFKLHSVDECKEVILALIEKKSVLLNLDELDSLQAQRALDTMSGATFAIGATLSRASDRTWLIAPNTVEVADSQANTSYGGKYM